MLFLITGGSASGKSVYAEELLLRYAGAGQCVYLATMRAEGAEAKMRIARHRKRRAGRGFSTVECPRDLRRVLPEIHGATLLECLPNLAANEMFREDGFVPAISGKILAELRALRERCGTLVVVTDEVFSDGVIYDEWTMCYLRELGDLHCRLAAEADAVIEVTCGIPSAWKGELP